jgi:hypothetical protein
MRRVPSHPQGDLTAHSKILRLRRQSSSEAPPQGMMQDANDRFHGMARLPAEGANRNDFNAVGIIAMHRFPTIPE